MQSGFMQAAACRVAAADRAAGVLARTSSCGQEQRHGFVDMLLQARETAHEPLLTGELERPGKIPVSTEHVAPDAEA